MDRLNLSRVAILLDVDGTLLDIAAEPGGVRVPRSLQRTLARLQEQTGGALAFISGRLLAELDRIFAPLRLAGIGAHGAEIRTSPEGPSGAFDAKPLDDGLKRRLVALAEAHPGIVAEDKHYTLALHFRRAPGYARKLREDVARLCAGFASEKVEILQGKAVIEVKSGHFNKGTAFRRLMASSPFSGRRPVFVGDDTSDEDVFAALPAFDGVGISVGRTMSGASHEVETPGHVRQWLDDISCADDRGVP
jgi:trehalose 6-phosphate phosphatase